MVDFGPIRRDFPPFMRAIVLYASACLLVYLAYGPPGRGSISMEEACALTVLTGVLSFSLCLLGIREARPCTWQTRILLSVIGLVLAVGTVPLHLFLLICFAAWIGFDPH